MTDQKKIETLAKTMSGETNKTFGGGCIVLLFSLVAWPFLVLWRAYVAQILWAWFVRPAFGWAVPSMYVLGGVMLLLALVFPWRNHSSVNDPARPKAAESIAVSIVVPLACLGYGWVWHFLGWGL